MSSRKGKLPNELWDAFRAMSVDVGRLAEFDFMKLSACMGLEERKLLAYSVTARDFFEDEEFTAFMDEFAIPFLTKLGRAKWSRDVVTDLGFALAHKTDRRRKLGERLLDFEPTEQVNTE